MGNGSSTNDKAGHAELMHETNANVQNGGAAGTVSSSQRSAH